MKRGRFCKDIGKEIKSSLKSEFVAAEEDPKVFSKEKLADMYQDLGLDVKLITTDDVDEFANELTNHSVFTEPTSFVQHLGKI